ncbi:hypothetical protein ER308_09310 [Egibacter rhizosphaerae]|uniref:Uncharacterized protein n=1 Tax=Egibacter rhizosphaerae TaxID=1670831 RepID=A0A411YF48_9ACTN|nr:hypothetical protein [Egibacter rhizosphaerae]QBI19727.1 hypothetical protein ER308_09310 [Egibacter rhizosphaerae]
MGEDDTEVKQPDGPGAVENVAILDLTTMRSADELLAVHRIENVALVLVPESLAGTLARIPTKNVASVVPVPDGADLRVHTGAVVMGGDALADPSAEGAVLVVTGTLAVSNPVEHVAFARVVVTGMVLAPTGARRPSPAA